MKRVLLPSDHRDWIVNFALGYREHGWDVTTGTYNFDLEASAPDVLHLNWPEELVGWKVPSEAQLKETIERLQRWARKALVIASVNNLYPHGQFGNPIWHRLYEAVYQNADVIQHFSDESKRLVCAEYPAIAERTHVVFRGFNYDHLLSLGRHDRPLSRGAFGFQEDELVYLLLGALRSWDEVRVFKDAFDQLALPGKRLLIAARYQEGGPALQRRWRHWRWRTWLHRRNSVFIEGYVPDEQLHQLFDAADVVVVVRERSLGSGLPLLAMTFGRMVIGPRVGAIPEYLEGAGNVLYEAGNATSLSMAMAQAARADRESVGAQNRGLASGWSWGRIIKVCLDALPPERRANGCFGTPGS